jgi:hypothetical protein
MSSKVRKLLVATLILAFSGVLTAQRSALILLVSTAEYFGDTYTKLPQIHGTRVFFAGEAIRLRVTVANRGPNDNDLEIHGSLSNILSTEALRDGVSTSVALTVGDPVWHAADGRDFPLVLRDRTALKAGESVRWEADVIDRLIPGAYQIKVNVNARDRESRPVVPHVSTLRFEVRPHSEADAPEIARRDATRRYASGDYEGAEAGARALLRLHPTSYEALVLLGQIATARGNADEARRYFERALDVLTRNDDQLLLKFRRGSVDHLIQSVAALAKKR